MYEQQGENLNGQLEQYEIFDYPGRYKDEQHGKDFTLYQMDSLRSDAEKATGQSNSPRLWPGTRFTLTGHPQKMLNREWQVIQSILSGDQPQALHGSRGGRGTTLGNQLEVIPADRTGVHGCIANRRWTGHRAPLSPVPQERKSSATNMVGYG